MPINKNKYDCSGCTACESICPKNCISMELDPLGFKYPKVDLDKCIHCELCVKVCPFDENYRTPLNFEEPIFYVGRSRSKEEIAKSQSGAAFAMLSDWILENNGIVYGAGYGENFKITHKEALTKEERDSLRGSKYVQSNLEGIFKGIKKELQKGHIVMFSGTPCQTAGLQSFIPEKLKDNLYVVDIICHGVPGPKIWEKYLKYLEDKNGSRIEKIIFRDKSQFGWRSYGETYLFINSKKIHTRKFSSLFTKTLTLRYSCGQCPYTNLRRTGDITIGDAWGLEKSASSTFLKDELGFSVFLLNTPKGKDWFESIKNILIYTNVEDKEPLLQPQLRYPTKLNPKRGQFESDFEKHGIEYVLDKYTSLPLKKRISRKIKRIFKRILGR